MNQIGRYTILKRLGGGGFGEVFLGEDPAIGRQVAIKVFRPKDENLIAFATSSDEEGLEILRGRFLSEAKILASLEDEPNVVGVLDYGELDDGAPYYVMPYLPRSLSDELGKDVFDVSALEELPEAQRPRALPLERALEILEQILTGLAAAHAKGLIHRDIKPSNLMFSESGQIRIVDFGIAKAPDGQHSTVSHLGLGSRNYMAPEQRESAKHVDARADVYSAGVVAYRMLTGKLPVGRFADPNVAVPALGRPMNDLLLAMVSLEKQDRPADAGEALAKFREARQSVGDDEGGEATGTWVGQGEAAVRDELKPLRAEIAGLVGQKGLLRKSDRDALIAMAAIAELEDADLDRLIEDVIKGDKQLAAKRRVAMAIQSRVKAVQGPLSDSVLKGFVKAASAVDWDEKKIKELMQRAVAELQGDGVEKASVRKKRTAPGFSVPIKPIAAALAAIIVLSAGGWGIYEWRQGQIAAKQAEQERVQAAAKAQAAWRDAQAGDTIEAYRSYLEQWPDGLNAGDARARIEELKAQGQSIIAQVQDYLNRLDYRVPQDGELDARTTESIKSFEEDQGLVVTGSVDPVLLESLVEEYKQRDSAAWEQALQQDSETAYRLYCEDFPEGRFVDEISERLAIVRDRSAWSEAESTGTVSSYHSYLASHPDGRYAEEAQLIIDRLLAERASAEKRRRIITEVQTELQRLGWSVAADGSLGEETVAAIRQFEMLKNRTRTGQATDALLVALRGEKGSLPAPPGETFSDCAECPDMVVIPGGYFSMGSPFNELGRNDNEGPQRDVEIQTFALAQTEVTIDQWAACVASGGCSYRPNIDGAVSPVTNVSWEDAREYVDWLSEETGKDYRLPTEAEWEYSARAGTTTRFSTGDCISTSEANFDGLFAAEGCHAGRSLGDVVTVRSFPPNDFGIHDMHGNVMEWVADCWNDTYRGAPSDGSAWKSGDCSHRVLRGGSWGSGGKFLRSAARANYLRESRNIHTGFRPARTVTL
ncbi:MAG: SUMF1/EgtB/PvdO family nonheme iron enzyme [Xanthomonadales bacterium]|nr:SUMF1/EgtB/PvdO family nonheme iron enzyme [Xanthomonadales bacterium]